MNGSEVLVPVTMFIAAAAVFIIWILSKHRERMTAIDKGLTPETIRSLYGKDKEEVKQRDRFKTLKWGMMFLFAGISLSVVAYLDTTLEHYNDGFKVGAIALSIGLALLITYFIIRNEQLKPQNQQPQQQDNNTTQS